MTPEERAELAEKRLTEAQAFFIVAHALLADAVRVADAAHEHVLVDAINAFNERLARFASLRSVYSKVQP